MKECGGAPLLILFNQFACVVVKMFAKEILCDKNLFSLFFSDFSVCAPQGCPIVFLLLVMLLSLCRQK